MHIETEVYQFYKNDQQDATVYDNLLFHCFLNVQHVSSNIIAHHQELLNCNYSFWFYTHLSLPADVMFEWELAEPGKCPVKGISLYRGPVGEPGGGCFGRDFLGKRTSLS